jgi:hypothetical protein
MAKQVLCRSAAREKMPQGATLLIDAVRVAHAAARCGDAVTAHFGVSPVEPTLGTSGVAHLSLLGAIAPALFNAWAPTSVSLQRRQSNACLPPRARAKGAFSTGMPVPPSSAYVAAAFTVRVPADASAKLVMKRYRPAPSIGAQLQSASGFLSFRDADLRAAY